MALHLTCDQAELAISRELDGELPRRQRRPLRAHLRGCLDCSDIRSAERARRETWKAFADVPLPASLETFFGRQPAAPRLVLRRGLVLRTAGALASAALVAGVAYELASRTPWRASGHQARSTQTSRPPVGLAAGERDARSEAAAGRSVGLARGEERARARAPRPVHEAVPGVTVGLARSERKVRNDARRGAQAPA
ncbi:MAG: zf-HC2 domain-containing protein [Gaiellaceae bacterium]